MRYIQWFTREFENRERTRTIEQGPTDTSIIQSIQVPISYDSYDMTMGSPVRIMPRGDKVSDYCNRTGQNCYLKCFKTQIVAVRVLHISYITLYDPL